MKLTKLVHQIDINLLYPVNLQIFREIYINIIKCKKYLLQNYKTGQVIAHLNGKFSEILTLNLNLK